MAQHNSSTMNAKEDIEAIKKEIEELVKRLGSLKDKSGDVMTEQLDHLSDTIAELKHKGEKKSKEILHEITTSTRKHPARNLAYAFGIGLLFSFIIRK